MSYSPTKEELDLYEMTALEHLEALKDILVAKDKHNSEDIRLEQTFQYGAIRQTLYKLEELKRDVKRYFELEGNYQKSSHEYHEMEYIKNKLMKVGNEDV